MTKKIKKKKKKDSLEKEPPKSNAEILEMKSKIEVNVLQFSLYMAKLLYNPNWICVYYTYGDKNLVI